MTTVMMEAMMAENSGHLHPSIFLLIGKKTSKRFSYSFKPITRIRL